MQKIGNRLIIILLSLTAFLAYASHSGSQAKLQILTTDNEPVSTIEPSVPFKIVITLPLQESTPDLSIQPEIEGLDNFTLIQRVPTMLQQDLLNRTGTLVFTYLVKTDSVGSYALGPISYKGETYPIKDTVQSELRHKEKDTGGFKGGSDLGFKLEKDTVYVGEPIPFSLVFRSDKKTERHSLSLPENTDNLTGFTIDDQEATQKWARNGSYTQLSWQGHFFAKKSGKIMIPAMPMQFISYSRFMFAFAFPDTETIYSSPAVLTVKPLPEPTRPIMAVGSFDAYELEPDKTKTAVGEGLVLKVSLSGRGNLDHIEHPPLTLPDAFRSFTSQTSIRQKRGVITKVFEYVLQATQEGEYTIPAQRFDYFDPKDETYKTLETEPVTITIEPGNLTAAPPHLNGTPPGDLKTGEPGDDSVISTATTDRPTQRTPSTRYLFREQRFLNIFFWLLLLLIAPIILLVRHWNQIRAWFRAKFMQPFSKRTLILLKHKISQLTDQRQLYHVMKKGLTRYFTESEKPLSDSELSKQMEKIGIQDKKLPDEKLDKLSEWHTFVNNLLHATQYAHGEAPDSFDQLKEAAYGWLTVIEEHGEKYKMASQTKQKSYFCILFCLLSLSFNTALCQTPNTHDTRDVHDKQDAIDEQQDLLQEKIFQLRWVQKLLTQPYQDEIEKEVTHLKRLHGYSAQPLQENTFVRMLNYFPLYFWQLIILILWTIVLLGWTKISRSLRIILLSLLLFSCLSAFMLGKKVLSKTGFTVSETPVYVGPGTGYPQKALLEPLTDFKISSHMNDPQWPTWYYISTDGLHGWVNEDAIEILGYSPANFRQLEKKGADASRRH